MSSSTSASAWWPWASSSPSSGSGRRDSGWEPLQLLLKSIYKVFIKYCVSKIFKYISDSGLSRFSLGVSVCTPDFMLGPLDGRWHTSTAAKQWNQFGKIMTFKGKNAIFNEHPVTKLSQTYGSIEKKYKLDANFSINNLFPN